VTFIMATTERHKLPATILSRCQQFVFRTISPAEIQAHLREIAAREGAKIDDRGLSYIVKAAEGSMRDAQSLLDQIISFGGQDVAENDVRDVLGFIPNDLLDRTLDAIAESNSKDLIETVGIVVNQGLNLQQYVRECIARVRDLLMLKLGLEDKVLGGQEEKAALAAKAGAFSEQDLIRYFDMLLRLEGDLRYTSQPRFHLEVGLVKIAKVGHVRDIEEVIREFKQGGAPAIEPAPRAPAPPPAPASRPSPRPAPPPAAAQPPMPPPPAPKVEREPAREPVSSFADALARRAEEQSPITAVYLRKAVRVEQNDNEIRIVMPDKTSLALLDTEEHRKILESAAAELHGKPSSVSLIIKDQPLRTDESRAESGSAMQSAKDEPLVKKFLEVFRGDIAQVKPAKGE
jgi:DNA polymerase-3 subunit gamma/tau